MNEMKGWAVARASGTTVVDVGPDVTEDSIWRLALGWPSDDEIRQEVARGGRAFRCKVVEVTDKVE